MATRAFSVYTVALVLFLTCLYPTVFWPVFYKFFKYLFLVIGLVYIVQLSLQALLSALPPNTRNQFTTHFPYISSLIAFRFKFSRTKIQALHRGTVAGTVMVSGICSALQACPRLLSLWLFCAITEEIWVTLPSSVTEIYIYGICTTVSRLHALAPPVWPQHSNLTTLGIFPVSLSLRELSILLAAAPHVRNLVLLRDTVNVSTSLTSDDLTDHFIDELTLLNNRILAGLQITSLNEKDETATRVRSTIRLIFDLGINDASSFLSASMQPLLGFAHVVFFCHSVKIDMVQVTRVFNSMRGINLTHTKLDGGGLLALGCCPSLMIVQLRCCTGVTCADVAALCAASALLREVHCKICKDMEAADGREKGRNGWGRGVQVSVSLCGRVEFWNN